METITLPAIDADKILDAIVMGELDPLSAKIWLKKLENSLEKIKEVTDAAAYDEAMKYGTKSFEKEGYKIEVMEYIAPRYDYAGTGHPKWSKYNSLEKEAAENRKAIEKQLVSLREPMTIADEDTGEVVNVIPPPKSGKSGIKLTRIA